VIQILQDLIQAKLGDMAFKLQAILNSPEENSVAKLDSLLSDYVMEVQKLKMLDEMIKSSNQEPAPDKESE